MTTPADPNSNSLYDQPQDQLLELAQQWFDNANANDHEANQEIGELHNKFRKGQ